MAESTSARPRLLIAGDVDPLALTPVSSRGYFKITVLLAHTVPLNLLGRDV
jgi:hypothetical protein